MSGTDRVSVAIRDRVAVITMHRPPVNAVDFAMIDAIHDAMRAADADCGVGAIVLASDVPGIFSGGMDLSMVLEGDAQRLRRFLERFYLDTLDIQHNLSKPSIAAVSGAARGAGMTLSITCDMIVAGEGADLGYPEINVGLLPAIHFAHLPQQIGRVRAFELLFTGEAFSPATALELGLINHVVPDDQVQEKALAIGRVFAAKSPLAMRTGRRAFMRTNDTGYRNAVADLVEMMVALTETPDGREGLAAFLQKRTPVWSS
ncbi:MAG: enoyl-CoA hydratase/isomerase family protein [Pseudomonadota bacterium]|nr:enoyl-CoA hydratase/isomerase family protein [Pseudomonadota bacterium]